MFCIHFLGTLASSLGSTVCVDIDKCVDVGLIVQEVIRSKGELISVEELVLTLPDGTPLPESITSCEVSEVRAVRLVRGG